MTREKRPRKRPKTAAAPGTAPALFPDVDATLLGELVARWRTTRSTQIADAIERLGKQVDDGLGAKIGQIGKQGPLPKCLARLATIGELPDDPRITVAIHGWLESARWPGAGAAAGWRHLFARLVALRDARAIAPLRLIASAPPEFLGQEHTAWIVSEAARVAGEIEAACAKRGDREDDDGANDRDLLARAEARITAPPADFFARRPRGAAADTLAIVQHVFDAPDDDDERRVAADALLEAEDPWGELIVIQLRIAEATATEDERARAETLMSKHAAVFCGPIAKIVKKPSRHFEKGFLVGVSTNATMVPRRDWEAAADAPHWATIQRVKIDCVTTPRWWLPAWVQRAPLGRLREIDLCTYERPEISLRRASATAPWRVTDVRRLTPGDLRSLLSFTSALAPDERARIEVDASVAQKTRIEQQLAMTTTAPP